MDYTPTYKTKRDYPKHPDGSPITPTATIYLNGLLCVCFDGSEECTVAVNQAELHIPRFGIWNKLDCGEIPLKLKAQIQDMRITVSDPVESGVYVYNPPAGVTPGHERYGYVQYSLDMEGPDLHNKAITHRPEKLTPRFRINNGLFCAYKLSQSRFALRQGNSNLIKGHIGLGLAADLFVKEGGSIQFFVNGATTPDLSLPCSSGAAYEIAITNSCTADVYDATSTDPMKRNDFYLYYQVVDVGTEAQFELVNIEPHGTKDRTVLGDCVDKGQNPVSDPSPCQHLGFGRTSKFT